MGLDMGREGREGRGGAGLGGVMGRGGRRRCTGGGTTGPGRKTVGRRRRLPTRQALKIEISTTRAITVTSREKK